MVVYCRNGCCGVVWAILESEVLDFKALSKKEYFRRESIDHFCDKAGWAFGRLTIQAEEGFVTNEGVMFCGLLGFKYWRASRNVIVSLFGGCNIKFNGCVWRRVSLVPHQFSQILSQLCHVAICEWWNHGPTILFPPLSSRHLVKLWQSCGNWCGARFTFVEKCGFWRWKLVSIGYR